MHISIIDTGIQHKKRYQIMIAAGSGFDHVFPGKLFTLEEAKAICEKHNFIIDSIGSIWQCTK